MCGTEFEAIEDLAMHVSTMHDGAEDAGDGDRFRADGSSPEPISDIEDDPAGQSPLSMSISDD
jgi:hypothetical protein